jgi:hypothetical protein
MEMSPFLLGESILASPRIKYTEFNITFKKKNSVLTKKFTKTLNLQNYS